ncbi:tyrosine-type recombinase/integrase [Pseudoalteromonas gelatinilytica]
MSDLHVETLILKNGERYPVLMAGNNFPHDLVTLWVTAKLHSKGLALNTITNKIKHIRWFLTWQTKQERNLFREFQDGQFLTEEDMENIQSHMAIDILHLKAGIKQKRSSRSKVINLSGNPSFLEVAPSVGRNHQYNRLTSVIEFVVFIAKLAVSKKQTRSLNQSISKMEEKFKTFRPKGKGKNVLSKSKAIDIPVETVEEFLSVAHFEHKENPFETMDIKFRNYLMFHLLEQTGMRRGELLSLQITHMTLQGSDKAIWISRTHDDVNDSRVNQAVTKTKERKIRISQETADLVNKYIMEYRSKIPKANNHAYLFVTHKKCSTQGNPVSTSTFDNTIVPTLKKVKAKFEVIHPHFFRHYWNEIFSKKNR